MKRDGTFEAGDVLLCEDEWATCLYVFLDSRDGSDSIVLLGSGELK